MIDEKDLKIVNLLQENARISNAEIARHLEMAPSAVFERIRRLEESGIITGYEAKLDAEQLGLGLVAFIFIRTDDRVGTHKTANAIAKLPGVQEIHDVAGEDCYVVKLRVRNTQDLAAFMREHLGGMKSIRSTRTTIVLETLKESGRLPVETIQPKERNQK